MLGIYRSFRMIAALAAITLIGDACQSSYTRQFQQSEANYGSQTGVEKQIKDNQRLYGTMAYGSNGHANQALRYDNEMSVAVSDLPGVFSAVVLTSERNAYAAVLLDSTGTGNIGDGDRKEGHLIGTTRGMYDWPSGREDADPNQIATGANSYFTAASPKDLTNLFKQRVAHEIRKINPRLGEVYISANRDFINQMNVYREESRRGVNLNLYLEDFNRQVKAHFQGE